MSPYGYLTPVHHSFTARNFFMNPVPCTLSMLEIFEFLFDPGVNMAIRDSLPAYMIQFLEIITILGDGIVLFAFAALFYWFAPDDIRKEHILILALAVSTLALVTGLKGIFQVPRPDLAFAPESYPGWSTPSAHAMGATTIYGGFAALREENLKVVSYISAGLLIFLISLSRVVLGVHYVGDVILGVIIGVILLYFSLHITEERTIDLVFITAILISIGAFMFGSKEFIVLSVGSSVGGLIGWNLVKYDIAMPKPASNVMIMFMLIPIAISLWVVDAVILEYIGVADTAILTVPVRVLFTMASYALMFCLAVVLPHLADRINHWDSVDRLGRVLPFC